MPVHIEELTSDVTVVDGDSFLTPTQAEKLVNMVLKRLKDRAREAERKAKATKLSRQAAKPFEV